MLFVQKIVLFVPQKIDGGIDFHVFNENFDNLPGTSSSCYREKIKGVWQDLNVENNLDAMENEDEVLNADEDGEAEIVDENVICLEPKTVRWRK